MNRAGCREDPGIDILQLCLIKLLDLMKQDAEAYADKGAQKSQEHNESRRLKGKFRYTKDGKGFSMEPQPGGG